MNTPGENTGECGSEQIPVYRLLAPGSTSLHRYTSTSQVLSTALANGWIAEGYGPNKVAMCGPTN